MNKTPYLHVLPPRLANAAKRLRAPIWTTDTTPLRVWAARPTDVHVPYAERPTEFEPVGSEPFYWGRSFQQRWFRLELPEGGMGDFTHLVWRDRAEATLYLDGVPVSGSDPGHPFVPMDGRAREILVESICCRTAIWVQNETQGLDDRGSLFQGAFLARRDEVAWQACLDYVVLWELTRFLAKTDPDLRLPERFDSPMRVREEWFTIHPLVRQLISGLDRAIDTYDREGPAALSAALAPLYEKARGGLAGYRAIATGHAHIDLVWQWPERIGEAKAVHTFANVLHLMDRYPEFLFGYSQPASYRAVARRSPELMRRVEERMTEGRWEAVGAMEVEADTNMACGEALARNLLLGQEEFQRLNGRPSPVVWLPDVFGYSACLPRLMQETGVEFFYTTKLTWSNFTRFPFTSFRWRGHDGTEIVSHVMGYDQDYNNTVSIGDLVLPLRAHRQADIHPEVLIPVGYGDGGGGPTEEMCERMRRCADLWGVPQASWGRIDAFFERLRPVAHELPVWDGEIYLEFHRGVLTTHVAVKQVFRGLERALQTLEAAHCVSGRGPIDRQFWRRLIMAQFHDDIPGSSLIEVVEEGVAERRALIAQAETKARAGLGSAAEETVLEESATGFFNPLPLPVILPWAHGSHLLEVPPLGCVSVGEARPVPVEQAVRWQDSVLENDRCRLRLNAGGQIEELSFDGVPVPVREPLGRLAIYPDHPALFEAWDIDRNSVGVPLPVEEAPRWVRTEESPGRVAVVYEQALTAHSRAILSWVLEAGAPCPRLAIDVDWADDEVLLRLEIPTGYRGTTARYGAPFGSVTRPQLPGTLFADARFEVPGSRWALIGDDGEAAALALITQDRYGFGCRDGLLHTTLLRSALITEARTNRPLREPTYTHTHSDHGRQHFELALAWGGLLAPRHEQPAALADRLFTPPLALAGGAQGGRIPVPSLPAGGSTLVPSWVKPAEDGQGWILRWHETRGQRGALTFTAEEARAWQITTLREGKGQAVAADGQVPYGPYDLLSLRWQPSASR